MGNLKDEIEKYIKSIENDSEKRDLLNAYEYSRITRQDKMVIHEAIINCEKINQAFTSKKKVKLNNPSQAILICTECEKIIAIVDFSKLSVSWRTLIPGIMMILVQQNFRCHICGSAGIGIGRTS